MPYLYTLIKIAGGLEISTCQLFEGLVWEVAEVWPGAQMEDLDDA